MDDEASWFAPFTVLHQPPQPKWVCDLVSERVCDSRTVCVCVCVCVCVGLSMHVCLCVFVWVCVLCQLFSVPAIADHLLAGADTQQAPGTQPALGGRLCVCTHTHTRTQTHAHTNTQSLQTGHTLVCVSWECDSDS